MERFQKVTPPPNRDLPDWASKNHLSTSPAYYQNYVLGELMASQVLRFLHRKIVKRESYVGNLEVGQFLIEKIFKPGARYPWNQMLQRATGEVLTPEHFIGQFVGKVRHPELIATTKFRSKNMKGNSRYQMWRRVVSRDYIFAAAVLSLILNLSDAI